MSKQDIALVLVLIAVAVAALRAVAVAQVRRRRVPVPPSAMDTSTDAPPGDTPPPAAPSKVLTSRERRREDVRRMMDGDSCIYCDSLAEHAMPVATSAIGAVHLGMLMGDVLPPQWRVRVHFDHGVQPVLCGMHHAVAVANVETMTRRLQLEYAEFVGAQRNVVHEFTSFGHDEILRAEVDRVRKGPKG